MLELFAQKWQDDYPDFPWYIDLLGLICGLLIWVPFVGPVLWGGDKVKKKDDDHS